MSYHGPIAKSASKAPQRSARCDAPRDPGGFAHLETIIGLIRQTTGAIEVLIQFQGDAPQPVALEMACIEAPLVDGRKLVGMLRAFAPVFQPGAQALLEGFGKLIVEQHALWAQAHVDVLTGALTRRAFADDMERAVARNRRDGDVCSLIMFDLDHFKKINDTYGHLAGDAVLRAVGRLVRRELRTEDRFGRLGGEEFGVLVAADLEGATEIAERLRVALRELRIKGFEHICVSASIGVASCDSKPVSVMTLMSQADERLYAAKNAGRDQVCAGVSSACLAARG